MSVDFDLSSLIGSQSGSGSLTDTASGMSFSLTNTGSTPFTSTGYLTVTGPNSYALYVGAPGSETFYGDVTVGNGVVTLTNTGGENLSFDYGAQFTQTATGQDFTYGGTAAAMAPVCYAAGTHILTDRGEIAVEALQPGDKVAALRGHGARTGLAAPLTPGAEPVFRAVRWIGRRTVTLAAGPNSDAVRPVRIAAGALGGGVPHRDLLVSPEHCLLLEGHLVPAKLLVNGGTIRSDAALREITYLHVELDSHDVVIAEGAWAESWLDAGNRAFFANSEDGVTALRPVPEAPRTRWNEGACAPHLLDGPVLEALRARLARVAATELADTARAA